MSKFEEHIFDNIIKYSLVLIFIFIVGLVWVIHQDEETNQDHAVRVCKIVPQEQRDSCEVKYVDSHSLRSKLVILLH